MASRKRKPAGKKSSGKSKSAKKPMTKKATPRKRGGGGAKSSKKSMTSKRRTTATRPAARSGAARRTAKVGANPRAAKSLGGRSDFGVPLDDRAAVREVSNETRHRDIGAADIETDDRQPRAGTESREAGVGGREAGPGSFSGGDIDTDITGVGSDGVGLAQAGPDAQP